jgi:enamine deaminase RidA (YjgF/YER057c/UK114 family)
MQVEFINPPGTFNPIPRGFSHVVKVREPGALVFIAGQAPMDDNAQVIRPGEIEPQARAAFEGAKRCLAAAGATFEDVVKMVVYLVNLKENHTAFRKVRAEYVHHTNRPVSTMIEVKGLALEGMLVEIDLIAAIR